LVIQFLECTVQKDKKTFIDAIGQAYVLATTHNHTKIVALFLGFNQLKSTFFKLAGEALVGAARYGSLDTIITLFSKLKSSRGPNSSSNPVSLNERVAEYSDPKIDKENKWTALKEAAS